MLSPWCVLLVDMFYRDDLSGLPYLTLCIKESMRMFPPVPGISRQLNSEVVIEGVTLLPGTRVSTAIYAMHHNPKVWGDDHFVSMPLQST